MKRPALCAVLVLAACGGERPEPPLPDTPGSEPDVATAVSEARDAASARPGDPRAWGRLAMVLDAHDFVAEASSAYARAAELEPRNFLWPYLAASCAREDPAAELALLERAHALEPGEPEVALSLGEALAARGRFAESAEAFAVALQAWPDHPLALTGAARAAAEAGDDERAAVLLQRALEQAPDHRPTHALLARVAARLGDEETARTSSERALVLDDPPPRPDPYRELVTAHGASALHHARRGAARLELGELDAAIADFSRAIEVRPDLIDARIQLGQALVLAGRAEEGLRTLRQAASLAPDHLAARRSLSAALAATGDLEASIEIGREVLARDPSDVELRRQLALLLRQLGRDEEAAALAR